VITPEDWLALGINAVLPALVALVTAREAHPGVKAVMLLFLSSLTAFLTTWQHALDTGTPINWAQAGVTALVGFAVGVLAHFGLLGPIALTGAGGVIQKALPRGIGSRFHGRHERN
jgi:hypothetical protein